MSITSARIALLTCFAVLSTLTCTQGSIPLDFRKGKASNIFEVDDADANTSNHSNVRVDRSADSLDPKKSFFAGEDTPVWVGYYANPNDKVLLTYEKLEKGIIKQAVDYWKSNEFNGISMGKRSVDDHMNLLVNTTAGREYLDDVQSPVSRDPERPKREIDWTVYRPSVLVVMEYGNTWPSNKDDERKLILERIIYALAYWNSIDIQLRPVENPWVRLRLGGIIIGRDRDETHHLYEVSGGVDYLHYEGTLERMNEYWGDKMRNKMDFRRGTYNMVALMTDMKQVPAKKVVAVSTDDSPCNPDKPGATGVIITYDDLKFSELQETFRLTTRMLGHGSETDSSCAFKSHWKSRSWNECNLNSIRTNLARKGFCMKNTEAIHDPGKPVETILPGSMLSWDEQCHAIGPKAGNICPGSTCYALRCQSKEFSGYPCEFWHPAMDGTKCDTDMICLNAECVSDKRLVYDWWMDRYEYNHS